MLAVRKIARGVGNIEVQEVPNPHPGPGQVVIEVDSAGICGTDLHIYLDEFETYPPVTIGHETAGKIVELGQGVTGWVAGDRVTTETYFYTCGECAPCRLGRRNLCINRRSIGSKQDGGFTRYLVTPAANLHRVPDELDLESAALTEPLACTVHGVLETAGVRAGDNVAITGPGPIGLLALQLAKVAGATVAMIGTDQDTERLALAKELGADHSINVQRVGNVIESVTDAFKADGVDLVIECSGAAPAAKTLLDVARRGARFCQMGLYGKPILFDQDAICYKELVVTGTNASVTSAWTRALKLLAEKKVNAKRLISHRFPIAEWDKALEVVKSKQGVKVVLKPGGGAE
jgi:L-iditol 2-dehydrogenase